MSAKLSGYAALQRLVPFMGQAQRKVISQMCRGEEGDWFKGKLLELAETVERMPKTYEQDGKGDEATVWLHYFTPAGDFWITERDMEYSQLQAFGLADLGYGPELGYISIVELLENGAELDLHYAPGVVTVGEIKAKREARHLAAVGDDSAEARIFEGRA